MSFQGCYLDACLPLQQYMRHLLQVVRSQVLGAFASGPVPYSLQPSGLSSSF